jgi:type II secretory pathway pseudopilin PulG
MVRSPKLVPHRRSERGYILITLILFVSLLTIAATIMLPVVAFQVKRDREEELIHRGVQYSRAMKHYVKKFGRYPTRLEDLENTNQVRFLRKRYKDPITGKTLNCSTWAKYKCHLERE